MAGDWKARMKRAVGKRKQGLALYQYGWSNSKWKSIKGSNYGAWNEVRWKKLHQLFISGEEIRQRWQRGRRKGF